MRIQAIFVVGLVVACGSSPDGSDGGDAGNGDSTTNDSGNGQESGSDSGSTSTRTVIVIPMENEPSAKIYGNTTDAPFINGLLATTAHTTNFTDELPALDSEPHYIWMEAGTNVFSDNTFSNDNAPSPTNSTSSTAHLVAQLQAANVSWVTYQEDITSGTCPINGVKEFAPKHDPFIFFQDVSGNPPSASNAYCIAHHKAYADFANDVKGTLPQYVFITPNLCHDMHGDSGCAQGTAGPANITAGDNWLKSELPAITAYANAHNGVVFITWDEGDSTNMISFIAIGAHVKAGGTSAVAYTHSSLLKSEEEMLGVPVLPSVTSANDFSDLFEAGFFP